MKRKGIITGKSEMSTRFFVVKDEDWFDIDQKSGKVVAVTVPTIRPYRRRSWTEAALREAWAYVMDQVDPTRFRISGSNASELAERIGLMTKKALAACEEIRRIETALSDEQLPSRRSRASTSSGNHRKGLIRNSPIRRER